LRKIASDGGFMRFLYSAVIIIFILCACLYPDLGQAAGMEFVFVQEGCYRMGDARGNGEPDERPAREVCIDGFFIGKYEVTQGQWKELMGANPSYFRECGDDCPVESVSWHDAQEFIKRLNQRTDGKYRLPTEAEWEYAARNGGRDEQWAGTNEASELPDYAWHDNNSSGKSRPVGQKKPNSLGLYDMGGNVWEWTQDSYNKNAYKSYSKNNPVYEDRGEGRVLRGGSWYSQGKDVRSSNRYSRPASHKGGNVGFRVVRTP
jgi:formylglycine-generating enzyme required for sulfatase activity